MALIRKPRSEPAKASTEPPPRTARRSFASTVWVGAGGAEIPSWVQRAQRRQENRVGQPRRPARRKARWNISSPVLRDLWVFPSRSRLRGNTGPDLCLFSESSALSRPDRCRWLCFAWREDKTKPEKIERPAG